MRHGRWVASIFPEANRRKTMEQRWQSVKLFQDWQQAQ
jgi:hypothetical protein